jgi:hypothetical protein
MFKLPKNERIENIDWYRDKNAAKNILLKNWFGFPSLAKQ